MISRWLFSPLLLVLLAGTLSFPVLTSYSAPALSSWSADSPVYPPPLPPDPEDKTPPKIVVEYPVNGSTFKGVFSWKVYIYDDTAIHCRWISINGVVISFGCLGVVKKNYTYSGEHGVWENGTTLTGLGYVFEDGTVLWYVYDWETGEIAYGVYDNGTRVDGRYLPYTTVTLIDGQEYCIAFWANDTSGNIGVTKVWVTADFSPPQSGHVNAAMFAALSVGAAAVTTVVLVSRVHVRMKRKAHNGIKHPEHETG